MLRDPLSQTIIGCAMKVHTTLGPGFLESVYRKALLHELTKSKLRVELEKPLPVVYDGVPVGAFVADMIVNEIVLLELKAAVTLTPAHEVQLVNYLAATNTEVGLLLNFGATSLQFKRKHRTYFARASSRDPNRVNLVNPVERKSPEARAANIHQPTKLSDIG